MIREAEEFADQDKETKARVDAKNALESYIYSMKNSIEDNEKLAEKLSD
jgi:heat shock protein 5